MPTPVNPKSYRLGCPNEQFVESPVAVKLTEIGIPVETLADIGATTVVPL
jgi:hypothetical protein